MHERHRRESPRHLRRRGKITGLTVPLLCTTSERAPCGSTSGSHLPAVPDSELIVSVKTEI